MAGFRLCAFKNSSLPEMQFRLTYISRLAWVTFKRLNLGHHYSNRKPLVSRVKPTATIETCCKYRFRLSNQVSAPLKDVELGGAGFTIQVQSGWTKAFLNGKPEAIPVQVPRIQKSCRLDFVR
jgi:hypothetical protein